MTNAASTVLLPHSRPLSQPVVRILTDSESARWDDFVLDHPQGSPFHLIAWKRTIEETFGYKAFYLAVWNGDHIEGILPLFHVRNIIVGSALISTPFAVYGGALCNSEAATNALRAEVTRLGRSLNAGYVELRNAHENQILGFCPVLRYVTFTCGLNVNAEEMLKAIPRKTRAVVRKSLTQNFETHIAGEDSKTFELLYARSLRRLGTPCFPPRLFQALLKHFDGMVEIREVRLSGTPVAAVMSFYFRDQVLPYYGASEPEFNAMGPSSFMYFDLMCSAGCRGFKTYDFGRSKKDSGGSHDFKAHWGMDVRELPYEMLLLTRKELPHFSPANPKFQMAIRLWQKMPFVLTRMIGPLLIRFFP